MTQTPSKRRLRRIAAIVAGAAFVSFYVHTCGQGSEAPLSSVLPRWLADATAFIFLGAFLLGLPLFGWYMIADRSDDDRFGSVVIGVGALVIWVAALGPFLYALWMQSSA